jgi:hypothetical protein
VIRHDAVGASADDFVEDLVLVVDFKHFAEDPISAHHGCGGEEGHDEMGGLENAMFVLNRWDPGGAGWVGDKEG